MPQRLTPRVAATFVSFHVALLTVAAAWYVVLLFVAVGFFSAGLLMLVFFALGPLAAAVAAWRFGRRLLRTHISLWVPTTVLWAAMPLPLLATPIVVHLIVRKYELEGPASPSGLRAIVAVSDAGFGPGADFYTSVRVLGPNGEVVTEWKNPHGSRPWVGPRDLRDSLTWTAPDRLEFRSLAGPIVLTVR